MKSNEEPFKSSITVLKQFLFVGETHLFYVEVENSFGISQKSEELRLLKENSEIIHPYVYGESVKYTRLSASLKRNAIKYLRRLTFQGSSDCVYKDIFSPVSPEIVFFATRNIKNSVKMHKELNENENMKYWSIQYRRSVNESFESVLNEWDDALEMIRNYTVVSRELLTNENIENLGDSVVMFLKFLNKIFEVLGEINGLDENAELLETYYNQFDDLYGKITDILAGSDVNSVMRFENSSVEITTVKGLVDSVGESMFLFPNGYFKTVNVVPEDSEKEITLQISSFNSINPKFDDGTDNPIISFYFKSVGLNSSEFIIDYDYVISEEYQISVEDYYINRRIGTNNVTIFEPVCKIFVNSNWQDGCVKNYYLEDKLLNLKCKCNETNSYYGIFLAESLFIQEKEKVNDTESDDTIVEDTIVDDRGDVSLIYVYIIVACVIVVCFCCCFCCCLFAFSCLLRKKLTKTTTIKKKKGKQIVIVTNQNEGNDKPNVIHITI